MHVVKFETGEERFIAYGPTLNHMTVAEISDGVGETLARDDVAGVLPARQSDQGRRVRDHDSRGTPGGIRAGDQASAPGGTKYASFG